MSTDTLSIIVTICIQFIGLGIFIGMQRAHNVSVSEKLKRIEDKQDKQNEEMAEVRERLAVVESVLDIKKLKK